MRRGILLLVIAALSVLAACGGAGDSSSEEESKGTVTFGLNNWAENIAVSNMWKVILEEKGYDIELKSMEKAPVWAGISQGDLDVAAEVWLPATDKPLYEEYKDDLKLHKTWYEGTGLGLVVPSYMDITSIEELNQKKDELGLEQIVGIDPGASLMEMSRTALEEYSLNYELVDSSGPAMMSELKKAYENEEPIVVTLWNPHWAFAEYDLKYLEDPKKVYGEADDIYYMTRTDFEEDHPEIVEWMNKWKMDDDSLGSLMATIKEADDAESGAKQWIEENQELVSEWTE
ncbi:glycine betaine ABC transporter substrate-binding protein [Guptibacillus hwajinpoensis]|uniref:Glycine betaine/proline transport system substrate-binding protein n=1 Tax=Guptibacillus hwajinpoensis TaxID=208199 RepID=A0ABU0K509_9BACL|nr:glycine betaine ABC transporter substrate-binding protein [Alkalihalobacillus hemicentroti]MDQ0483596.1 glycine betaine/proline transport system substrate-binding protein [Alkalihalobacillus hemicentroti]